MPYPYTLMPDGHTMEDEVKPPAETQEESTRPNSPFQDFGNPSSSPSSPSSSQPPSPPPGGSQPSQSVHDHGYQTGSQSSGKASSSKSDEQGSKGSSQAEDSNDANKAKDETHAQVALRDIAEVQDDFGTSWVFHGINPDRWHRYNNPDVIRVQQDMERRPLTFKRCFEQAESPRSALEFIYANPPVIDENELRHLEQMTVQESPDAIAGMGGGGADDAYDSGFTNSRSITRYEEHLESKYGIQIEWGDSSDATNKADQLGNLAQATSLIVNYLTAEVYDGDESAALFAFRQFFGQSEFGRLVVNLGADDKLKESTYGRVPLAYYNKEGKLTNENLEELNQMYLGSAVDVSTIVHEFGHVIDRSVQIVWRYENDESFQKRWMEETDEMPLSPLIYENSIEGIAGKSNPNAEIWADIFMTMVLDPAVSGRTYEVFSVKEAYDEQLSLQELFDCGCDNASGKCKYCDYRDVEWRRFKNRNLKSNARSVMEYMPEMLAGVMNPSKWRRINESDLENL